MSLVITRKHGESVKIGADIEVTVQITEHGRVRLAIDAPRHVMVLRKELTERPAPGVSQ